MHEALKLILATILTAPLVLYAQSAAEPVTREFLIGAWVPEFEVDELDGRVQYFIDNELEEAQALRLTYYSWLNFYVAGDACVTTQQADGHERSDFEFRVELREGAPTWLWVQLGPSPPQFAHELTREGDRLRIKSPDPTIDGLWARSEREIPGPLHFELAGIAAGMHSEFRAAVRSARATLERLEAVRRELLEQSVRLVKAACEAEDRRGDASRVGPLMHPTLTSIRLQILQQDMSLMSMPFGLAPPSPLLEQHRQVDDQHGAPFDEAWLAGTWRLDAGQVDWSALLSELEGAASDLRKELLCTRRQEFAARGTYRVTSGAQRFAATGKGYHVLMPSADSFVRLALLESSALIGQVTPKETLRIARAYRVAERLWMEDEGGRVLPWVRDEPKRAAGTVEPGQ